MSRAVFVQGVARYEPITYNLPLLQRFLLYCVEPVSSERRSIDVRSVSEF